MMNRKIFLLLGLIFIFSSLQNLYIYCEDNGFKYSRNFTPKDYNHQPQNWCIVQDQRGIIYVGNNGGLLEFDGVSWRLLYVSNWVIRSMAIDKHGNIYTGGRGEIGFWSPQPNGSLEYVSLIPFLENNRRNFSDVWKTHWTKEGVYFNSHEYLFRWVPHSKQLKVWRPTTRFNATFTCSGKFFIHQENIGIMQMKDDSLEPVPGGHIFAKKRIFMIVPYNAQCMLIGTRSKGLYLYDGLTFKPFHTEIDDYLEDKQVYHGIRLSSGDFAMATRRGGLVVMNSRGELTYIFNKNTGLQNDNVKYVFEDLQGNLWLALNEGISKIEYASPIFLYDKRSDLSGIVLAVVKHRDVLYAGTTSGLFTFDASIKKFRLEVPITSNCWDLLTGENSILAATSSGVFQIHNNHITHKVIGKRSYVLLRSQRDPNRIWVGTRSGLISIYYNPQNNQWTKEHQFTAITLPIRSMVQDQTGNLWLGTLSKGVLNVSFPNGSLQTPPMVTHYNTSHGLPPGEVGVFWAAGHVMFTTKKGIFRFHELKKTFVPDTTLGDQFAGGAQGVFRIAEDKNNRIWLHSRSRNFKAVTRPGGTFIIHSAPFLRIPRAQVNMIYPDPDGVSIWFVGSDGLLRYNTSVKKNFPADFSILTREVVINGIPLIYDTKEFKYNKSKESKPRMPVIAYKDRNLRFEVAAPFFEAETETTYRYFLEGYDNHWSDWRPETKKDYTNLDSGRYIFHSQAKNVYGYQSREAVFQFKISPPWTKTWWAYSVYTPVVLLMVFFIVKWRSKHLEKEKRELEQIVKKRTNEIEEKNQQLEEQSEQLKEMDKVKSRFFANISHEFRTPLTLIMGPLEQIITDFPDKDLKNQAGLMLRNSQRLLNLVNQLLELSKFESGKVKLQVSKHNIVPFLKNLVACFETLAIREHLDLTFHAEEQEILLYFDPEKLEKIILNLLSNAFKFTSAGGKITISVKKVPTTSEAFPPGFVEISVCDTGIGIPENQLPFIFERFFQADGLHEYQYKGSGIGLSLTKELVTLHYGEIGVHSDCSEGETRGTKFIVRLPPGKTLFKPDEIVDLSGTIPGYLVKGPLEIPGIYRTEKEEEVVEKAKSSGTAEDAKDIILVVEDSSDVRSYIKGALEPLYRVKQAADGKEGIDKAIELIPDLIISDIMMPGLDGYELCRTLKKDTHTSHIPIILLTAKTSVEHVVQGLETGADDYITKPFSNRILAARVKNLIDLRRHLQLKRKNQLALQPGEISVSAMDEDFYKELAEVIEKNISSPELNVDQLGKKLYMGRTTLYRKVLAITGETPYQLIRSYRLLRAAQLLKTRSGNVSEVAFKVGFTDMSYFARCFKEKFHQLPSQFQANGWELQRKDTGMDTEKEVVEVPGKGKVIPPHIKEEDIILVVEDSDDARHYIRDSLEPLYQVVEAGDGKEGIAKAQEIIPDLIISDIMMPGTDGYELCRVLKTDIRTSHIPIILLTAKASEESVIQGLETGADDYITKPFNTRILKVRIRNLIDLRRRLQLKRKRSMTLLPVEMPVSSMDETFYQELQDVIETNLSDPGFNVEVLSEKLLMGRTTLYRKILAVIGETPNQLIRSYRLKRAAQLLKSGFGNVTDVTFEVGFSSTAYFTRCFKEKFHQLPSTYQAAKSS
jgi:DNA-binding response OmpR family regulator/signal transduction histidine kinase